MTEDLLRRLALAGIAHTGSVSRADFDRNAPAGFRLHAIAPGAESVLVAASAGANFWHAFVRFAASHSGWLNRQDPLDDFTRLTVDDAVRDDKSVVRVFFPFFSFEPRLPFQKLGALAQLGRPSPLGLLVHPIHGPWFALRAAIALTTPSLVQPAIASPCDTCPEKPCISACPAGAVKESGWALEPCVAECQRGEPCASGCDARRACPVGREFAYPEDAVRHHHTRGFLSHFRVVEDGVPS